MEVQRRLHEQLEVSSCLPCVLPSPHMWLLVLSHSSDGCFRFSQVQRHLQLRIEAQGKYLQSILEKARETLAAHTSTSPGLAAADNELSDLASKVSDEGPNSTFPSLTVPPLTVPAMHDLSEHGGKQSSTQLQSQFTDCSSQSYLTSLSSENNELNGNEIDQRTGMQKLRADLLGSDGGVIDADMQGEEENPQGNSVACIPVGGNGSQGEMYDASGQPNPGFNMSLGKMLAGGMQGVEHIEEGPASQTSVLRIKRQPESAFAEWSTCALERPAARRGPPVIYEEGMSTIVKATAVSLQGSYPTDGATRNSADCADASALPQAPSSSKRLQLVESLDLNAKGMDGAVPSQNGKELDLNNDSGWGR